MNTLLRHKMSLKEVWCCLFQPSSDHPILTAAITFGEISYCVKRPLLYMFEHNCQENSDTAALYSYDKSFMRRSEGERRLQVFVTFLRVYSRILCFVDCASLYNLVNKANFVHNLLSMFISFLYMFRATVCLSSREITVSIRHLVFVTLCGWLSGKQRGIVHQVGFIYRTVQ
jgi:hypothetical protein